MIQDGETGHETKAGRLPKAPSRTDGNPAPASAESLIACPINESFTLVLGAGIPMSGAQAVMLNGDPALPGKAPVVSWPLAEPKGRGSHGFVALVFAGPLKGERLNVLAFRAQGRAASYRVAPEILRPAALAATLASLAGAHLPAVIDAIVAMLSQGPMSRRKLAAMTTFVEASAKPDGFIEIIGAFEDGDVYVQGWSSDVRAGVSRILIAGATSQIAECTGAAFDRQDLNSKGMGFAALLVAPEPIDPFGMQRIYFRGRDGWRYSDVYEQRLLAPPRDTPGFARAMLPKIRASAEVVGRLRGAAYRYEGLDTVSGLALPVRMAIDHALRVEQGGLLLSGWFLDPDHRVEGIKLRRRQVAIELSESWSRVDRPDVSAAFDGQPPFAQRFDQAHHAHGFTVFVPDFDTDGSAPIYVELAIPHAPPAYLPVVPKRASYREAVARQLRSISARAAAASDIVERHLTPLVSAAETRAASLERLEHIGAGTATGDTTLVIGIDEHAVDAEALLALLALDPEIRLSPVTLAGPEAIIAGIRGEARRLAEFYDLSLDLVSVGACNDVFDALTVGAGAARTDRVVLLSGLLVPEGKGWFGQLCAAHRETDSTVIISPALLYEDDSIRWAGYRFGDDAGGLSENYVGYPAATLDDVGPDLTPIANLECCVLSKSAIAPLVQGGQGYLGNRAKGMDLALRLAKVGTRAYWLPAVRMLGAEGQADRDAWDVHARSIDRVIFRKRWSETIATMARAVAA
jgi:hypothetical protein